MNSMRVVMGVLCGIVASTWTAIAADPTSASAPAQDWPHLAPLAPGRHTGLPSPGQCPAPGQSAGWTSLADIVAVSRALLPP
jgi:hypothetical protein